MPHAVADCRIVADTCEFVLDSPPANSGAIEAVRSDLTLTNCLVRATVQLFGPTSQALRLDESTVRLVDTTLTVMALPPVIPVAGVCGGASSELIVAAPAPATTGCVNVTIARAATLTVSDLVRGQGAAVRLHGVTGSAMFLFASVPTSALATVLGDVFLGPSTLQYLGFVVQGPAGFNDISLPALSAIVPDGAVLAFQAFAVDGSQTPSLSAATMAVVR